MAARIQKVLANLGLASRREIERWVVAGRITINGNTAALGDTVNLNDKVAVDGDPVRLEGLQEPKFLIYNKVEGELVTQADPEGRPTVFDNLPEIEQGKWINIGRLDFNTSGLLIFTNRGDIAHKLTHPSQQIEREYAVRVFGDVASNDIKKLVNGVKLEDGMARFEDVVAKEGTGSNRWFYVVVTEGRNRVVRRLWESIDAQVSRLVRVRFGCVNLPKNLRSGHSRELKGQVCDKLIALAGLDDHSA